MIDQHPVGPVRRSPACTCCRRGRVRVAVMLEGAPTAWACPRCDRVEPSAHGRPLVSAPKAVRPA